jgi:Fe2+ transport system protein FeoA
MKGIMRLLSDCKQGDIVHIRRIHGEPGFKKRLLEMGFLKQTPVRIVRYAPLRDPLELSVKDTLISLRVCEAAVIEVEPALVEL